MTAESLRCVARVRRYTGKRFPQSTRCEKSRRAGKVTCWSHRAQEPEKCQFCGLDPAKPENKGLQVYVCDKCEALCCTNCSEDGPRRRGQVYCKTCDHEHQLDEAEKREGQEPSPDRCSRCDALISRTRADRFSICETCAGSRS